MKKDLIIIAADSSAQAMLAELLHRFPRVLGMRDFSSKVFVHPGRDPGCYTKGVSMLDQYALEYEHCILIFDHEGCGAEHKSPVEIECELEKQLTNGLWRNRNAVIVIEPELENWVWTNSLHTARALGWEDLIALNGWLTERKWVLPDVAKPKRPKEAMEAAMKKKLKENISANTFATIAAKASFKSCASPSFIKFKDTIVRWFTTENP